MIHKTSQDFAHALFRNINNTSESPFSKLSAIFDYVKHIRYRAHFSWSALTNQPTPNQIWAFNFIQILSEIVVEHPDLLVLVLSVRNGQTEAYKQIHRNNPAQVDFKGPYAKRDRQRLLLHRLFENRRSA